MSDGPWGPHASRREVRDVVLWSKMIPAIEVRHRIELVRSVRMPPDDLVFFTAPGDSGFRLAPKPGTECTAARWMTPAEIGDLATNPDWLPLTEDLLQ